MHFVTKTIQASALLLCSYTFLSCQKEVLDAKLSGPTHQLRNCDDDEGKLKINQSILVYDATELTDSMEFLHPPTDTYYEWTVIPGNGCASASGHLGAVDFQFTCSGKYQLTATIYDAATRQRLANTDTVSVEVTSDTLQQVQAIEKDDVLILHAGIMKTQSCPTVPCTGPIESKVYLTYSSTREYEYSDMYNWSPYTSTIGTNNYAYAFADSIRLVSYPSAHGNWIKTTIQGGISLNNLTMGVPASLSIKWLGKEYKGTVTLHNDNDFTIDWDNSGAVKFN